jgi:hypothetical protein
MNVDDFAVILRDPAISLVDQSRYPWKEPRGYRAELRLGDKWYWYSVSDTLEEVSPKEVADAITASSRKIKRSGAFKTGADSRRLFRTEIIFICSVTGIIDPGRFDLNPI